MSEIQAPRRSAALLRYFEFDHLPPDLRAISSLVGDVAREMDARLPQSAELTAGLRKLLEAKDCFVRAALDARPQSDAL